MSPSLPTPETALREILALWGNPPSTLTPSKESLVVECALCLLVQQSVSRSLRLLFDEFVNDTALRESFRKARGFCAEHTRQLALTGDALALSILYSDLADQTLERWRRGKTRAFSPPFGGRRIESPAPCLACQTAEEASNRYSDALAQGLQQAEVREAYAQSAGLCVAHVERILSKAKPEPAALLLAQESERLKHLYNELAEVIRKNDYRFRNEEWGEERDAWLRALPKITRP